MALPNFINIEKNVNNTMIYIPPDRWVKASKNEKLPVCTYQHGPDRTILRSVRSIAIYTSAPPNESFHSLYSLNDAVVQA